jgi:hypothetical protein
MRSYLCGLASYYGARDDYHHGQPARNSGHISQMLVVVDGIDNKNKVKFNY